MIRAARLAAALALALAASPAAAAVALPMSVEGLARSADLVVRGRVRAQAVRWTDDRRRILTAYQVEPLAAWRGRPGGRLTVVVPGGSLDGVTQIVPGAPALAVGEEVVLFLSHIGGAEYRVQGLGQGKFGVVGARGEPDLGGFTFLPGRVPVHERRAEPMGLGELERRVRSAR